MGSFQPNSVPNVAQRAHVSFLPTDCEALKKNKPLKHFMSPLGSLYQIFFGAIELQNEEKKLSFVFLFCTWHLQAERNNWKGKRKMVLQHLQPTAVVIEWILHEKLSHLSRCGLFPWTNWRCFSLTQCELIYRTLIYRKGRNHWSPHVFHCYKSFPKKDAVAHEVDLFIC